MCRKLKVFMASEEWDLACERERGVTTPHIMSHRHVFLLRGDVALCCMVLFTHLPVMFSAPRAAHTDTRLTQYTAGLERFLLPTSSTGLLSRVITAVGISFKQQWLRHRE